MKVVLLPGLDGTGDLFYPFVETTPNGWSTQVVQYPRDEVLNYSACTDIGRGLLPANEEFLLLGESFSGPVALELAAESPPGLRGVIICNSFARRPWSSGFRLLPWSAVFAFPIPRIVLRRLLGAGHGGSQLEERFRSTVGTVEPGVLAGRLRDVLTVDSTPALTSVRVPMLYLRGSRDPAVRRQSLSYIQATRPEVEVVELPVSHLLLQIAPIEAWRAVVTFASERCAA